MSTYKKFNRQDAYISTYTSRKSWIASGSQYKELGINNIAGVSSSGDYYNLSQHNFIAGNSQTTSSNAFNTRLIYESLNHLYYKDFVSASLPTSSSYESYLQSSFEVSGSRYLFERVALFSLPKEMYGTHIEPTSVSITPDLAAGTDSSGSLDNYVTNNYATDLGVNSIANADNLYIENIEFLFGSTGAICSFRDPDYIENEDTYVDETDAGGGEYLDTANKARNCNEIVDDGEGRLYFKYSIPKVYVGNVIYTHGQIIITDVIVAKYYNTYLNAILKWKSNLPIYTHNYHCKIKASEFNFTYNKTGLQKVVDKNAGDGKIANLISGSYFNPYITTVGLYNDSNELIAVGKMGSPTPKSSETDMSVLVKLDMNFGSDRLLGGTTGSFLPSDPTEDENPPNVSECVYYFTFRNYYRKGSRGTNNHRDGSNTPKPQNKRKIIDYGEYVLYRKRSASTTICKSHVNFPNQEIFDTFNFTAIRKRLGRNAIKAYLNSYYGAIKKGYSGGTNSSINNTFPTPILVNNESPTAVCYVDVKVTITPTTTDSNSTIAFDFTQLNGSQYDPDESTAATSGPALPNRSKAFYRDIIRDYLLEEAEEGSFNQRCTFSPQEKSVCP